MRTIVASSDDALRRFVAHILSGAGCDVRTVSRSSELLRALLDADYDLVVVNLALGGMSGLETLPILKRLRPKTPVIVLSEDDSAEVRAEAFESGALYYFVLPINPSALTAAVGTAGQKIGHEDRRDIARNVS